VIANMARGSPQLSFFDEIDKLWKQKHRCNVCEEDLCSEDGKTFQELSKKLNREKWGQFLIDSKANGNTYYLSYLKKRNEGGKNEPSNIQIVCPNCESITKTVSVRLPKKLVERMDEVIEFEKTKKIRPGQKYSRSDFLNDAIETMVLLDEFNRHEFNRQKKPLWVSGQTISAFGHTIEIRDVKKTGGKHEGKLQLVISGPKVEHSGRETKTLYSDKDSEEARQKVAKWLGYSVEDDREYTESITKYSKLSILNLKMRSFRRKFSLDRYRPEENDGNRTFFELAEKNESDLRDINEIELRLKAISERSLRMDESLRKLKFAFQDESNRDFREE